MFSGLNRQYSHISTSVAEETRLQTVGLPFSSFDLAFQYKFDDVKATTDAGSTSTGGDNSRVFYVKFGYVTNKVFGKRYGLDYNNYVTIQVGYSRSISEVFTAVKDLVGLGGSSSKTAD